MTSAYRWSIFSALEFWTCELEDAGRPVADGVSDSVMSALTADLRVDRLRRAFLTGWSEVVAAVEVEFEVPTGAGTETGT